MHSRYDVISELYKYDVCAMHVHLKLHNHYIHAHVLQSSVNVSITGITRVNYCYIAISHDIARHADLRWMVTIVADFCSLVA